MKPAITELNNLIDKSITRLNQERFKNAGELELHVQQNNVKELKQLLADLSGGAVDKQAVEDATLMLPPDDITELEKAIVCVALYWLGKDVREDNYCGNNKNASKFGKFESLDIGKEVSMY